MTAQCNINVKLCFSLVLFQVPTADIREDIESFRIQDLVPDTVYVIQIRCKKKNDYGYWSDWSTNATQRTLEDRTFYDDTNRFNIVCDSVCQGCFCLPHPRAKK